MFRAKNNSKTGFTIVETMISVIFISILLIAVGAVSLHIINAYQRGIVLKMVNETGRAISDDLRNSLASGSVNLADDFYTTPEYGIFCTGNYTYIWNYASALKTPNSHIIRYRGASVNDVKSDDNRIRLIKILDRSRQYCVIGRDYSAIEGSIPAPASTSGENKAIEVIKPSEGDLMIYDMAVARGASDGATNQSLYQISFSIGTFQHKEIIKQGQCVPNEADQVNCAINRFDISILTKER